MQIDEYRLLEVVNQGMYGPVYRGERLHGRAAVALQVLRGARPLPTLPSLQAHLQTLRKLGLHLVPTPQSCGALSDGSLYLASQWIAGQRLFARPLSQRQLLRLFQGIAATMEAAHQHGIYHLQLRPSQILIREAGGLERRAFIIGLGIYQLLGPPLDPFDEAVLAYLSPERRAAADPHAVSGATDVYSLAILLKRVLDESAPGFPRRRSDGDLPPAAREQLQRLITAMRDSDPAQRPLMRDVNSFLYALLHSGPGAAPGPRSVEPSAPKPPAAREPGQDPLIGQNFGSFRLLRLLGKGAMGAVYEARHELIEHRAAVKVLRPKAQAGKDYARRFLDEARAVNIVEHPGLVSIFEFGQREDGLLYIVMEYLPGDSLELLLRRRDSPLPQREALSIALQAAQALAAAHECGIVHRDIKPSNLMMLRDTLSPDLLRVKIVDFGIAKVSATEAEALEDHTEAGAIMGTLAYMAPEQYGDAKKVDGKADVFALGVVVYEMLTLKSPFGDATSSSVLSRPARALPSLRGGATGQLAVLLARMLEREAAARPTMAQVIASLRDILQPRRSRVVYAALGIAIGLAVSLTVGLLRSPSNIPTFLELREAAREKARRKLEDLLLSTRQSSVLRAEAARALGLSRDTRYLPLLTRLVADPSIDVSRAAIEALGELGDPRGLIPLRHLVAEGVAAGRSDEKERAAALALFRLRKKLGTSDSQRPEQQCAERIISKLRAQSGDKEARSVLLHFLQALYSDSRAASRSALRQELLPLLLDRAIPWQDRVQPLRFLLAESDFVDDDITQALRQLAQKTDRLEESLTAQAFLRKLGYPDAAAEQGSARLLRQQVESQPTQARIHVSLLGDQSGCALLARIVDDETRAEVERGQSADGLAGCPFSYLSPLVSRLDDAAQTSLPIQVAIAGSIVRALGPPPAQIAALSAGVARRLDGLSLEDRLGVLELAGALPNEEGVPVLMNGLRDREPRARDLAARLLAGKPALQRLRRMREALLDANTDVQQSGMKAIIWLLAAQPSNQAAQLEDLEPLRARVRFLLSQTQDQTAQAVARVLLYRLGDRSQRARLESLMREGSEATRLLLIEVLADNDPLLRVALEDRSDRVRFFAARRLAEAGRSDGAVVLRSMLERTDESALFAYWLLRRLRIEVAPPRHLQDLLGRGSPVYTRMEVIRILAQTSSEQSVALLEQASRDGAAVVRAAVAQAARDLLRLHPRPALLDLLNRLRTDDQPTVRRRAQLLWEEILHEVSGEPASAPSSAAPSTRDCVDAGTRAAERPSPPPAANVDKLDKLDRELPAPVQSARVPPRTPPTPPTEKELLAAALQKAQVPLTRARGISELQRILEANKQCASVACQQAKAELGQLLIEGYEVGTGLGYLKSLWGRQRGATAMVALPDRQAIFSRYADRLTRLTIRKPMGTQGCATILDDLFEPGGSTQVSTISPERFYLNARQHLIRDCCAERDKRTETCAALQKERR